MTQVINPATGTTIASTSALKTATNQQVRSKFLNMIGIEAKLPPTSSSCDDVAAQANKWVNPRSQQICSYTEPLKYDPVADRHYGAKRRKKEGNLKPKKKLGFNESVEVIPIPMRTEYSNRVRSRLWSNAIEIYENAARNTIEFATEGWDWRSVTEDEGMYVCVATGELIHPCHYDAEYDKEGA